MLFGAYRFDLRPSQTAPFVSFHKNCVVPFSTFNLKFHFIRQEYCQCWLIVSLYLARITWPISLFLRHFKIKVWLKHFISQLIHNILLH